METKENVSKAAEHVLAHGTPKAEAKAKAAGYSEKKAGGGDGAKGNAAEGGKKEIREMKIRRGHKGGFVAQHVHQPPHNLPEHDEEYPIADTAGLHSHIDDHFGEGEGGGEGEGPAEEAEVQKEAAAPAPAAQEEA